MESSAKFNPEDNNGNEMENMSSNTEPIDTIHVSFIFPQNSNSNSFSGLQNTINVQSPPQRRASENSTLVIDDFDFQLTEEEKRYIKRLNEVQLAAGDANPATNIERLHLSLAQRIEAWRIEKRKNNEFYYHKLSKRIFRSMDEVESFNKYGLCP